MSVLVPSCLVVLVACPSVGGGFGPRFGVLRGVLRGLVAWPGRVVSYSTYLHTVLGEQPIPTWMRRFIPFIRNAHPTMSCMFCFDSYQMCWFVPYGLLLVSNLRDCSPHFRRRRHKDRRCCGIAVMRTRRSSLAPGWISVWLGAPLGQKCVCVCACVCVFVPGVWIWTLRSARR